MITALNTQPTPEIKSADRTASQKLGQFVAELRPQAIPENIMHEAKRSLINYFGNALGGASDSSSDVLLKVMQQLSPAEQATVIGSDIRVGAAAAAFLNAERANVLDFDDTHMPTIIHPSAPVAPPLFVLAELKRLSGKDLLTAFVAGVEVTCRLGLSVHPGHYARGWHVTATCGVIGAAAAACRAIGLSGKQTSQAIGIAASQSAGLVENLPTGAKNVQIGNSAQNGLLSALLAANDLESAPTSIEGQRGWARAMGDVPNLEILCGNLGSSWELSKNTYKAYACGIVLAPVIDASLALRKRIPVGAAPIDDIVVRGSPLLLARADRSNVIEERIAKLSLQHVCAAALHYGKVGLNEFGQDAIENPAVADLRRKIIAVADESLTVDAVVVEAHLADGSTIAEKETSPRGSLAKPLTDANLEDKARELARFGKSTMDLSRLIDAIWTLDASEDAGALMALVHPSHGKAGHESHQRSFKRK